MCAFQIGQCCADQVLPPPVSAGGSGLNEPIRFDNTTTVSIAWNTARIARFGPSGVFYVELMDPDGVFRRSDVEALPDDIDNTTMYTFNFGMLSTGRITIT